MNEALAGLLGALLGGLIAAATSVIMMRETLRQENKRSRREQDLALLERETENLLTFWGNMITLTRTPVENRMKQYIEMLGHPSYTYFLTHVTIQPLKDDLYKLLPLAIEWRDDKLTISHDEFCQEVVDAIRRVQMAHDIQRSKIYEGAHKPYLIEF